MTAFIHGTVPWLPHGGIVGSQTRFFRPRLWKTPEPPERKLPMMGHTSNEDASQLKKSTKAHRKNTSGGEVKRNSKNGAREDPAVEMTRYDPPSPFIDLGAPPSEARGFYGWSEEDDEYFRHFRELDVSFRAPSLATAEDLKPVPRPLDRHGNPANYAAAVRYDEETGEWVPTTEEEEEELRTPSPIIDPYFIREASAGESPTSLSIKIVADSAADDLQENSMSFSTGNPELEHPHPSRASEHRRRPLKLPPAGWRVVHLGTSSAIPTRKRNVSSTAVIVQPKAAAKGSGEPSMFIVDAGENTDWQLRECNWCMTHGFRWIRAIFITHLHGDHIYGLPVLLSSIGRYAQFRRRLALESGDEGCEPTIRIYGPYGTRGFVRSSLYWTNPLGVRFSVAELIPREKDFSHIRGWSDAPDGGKIYVGECGSSDVREGSGIDVERECAPPHPEEVRVEDVHASEDGLWHVWSQDDEEMRLEVVAAPLRHRLPCFGYVFREAAAAGRASRCERKGGGAEDASGHVRRRRAGGSAATGNGTSDGQGQRAHAEVEIDMTKARELGVYGSQFRVLRSGRAVTVSKTGAVVRPEDVAVVGAGGSKAGEWNGSSSDEGGERQAGEGVQGALLRSATILGDTCDSSAIAEAAMNTDLLVHEATFSHALRAKARMALHSTARMAGEFARRVKAKKMALTHFSSRYEGWAGAAGAEGGLDDMAEDSDEDEDLANAHYLVGEARRACADRKVAIVAAEDFMEHDIAPVEAAETVAVGGGERGAARAERGGEGSEGDEG